MSQNGGVPAKKVRCVEVNIDGLKSTQFSNLVIDVTEVRENSFEVPIGHKVQFGAGRGVMKNAALEISLVVEAAQRCQAKLL